MGDVVLRDRKILSEDGLMMIIATMDKKGNLLANVEVMSRGFVYMKESEELIEEVKNIAKDTILKCGSKKNGSFSTIKNAIKDELNNFLYRKTMRRPMIIPVIVEIEPGA